METQIDLDTTDIIEGLKDISQAAKLLSFDGQYEIATRIDTNVLMIRAMLAKYRLIENNIL